jgi:hypothetical protein
MQRRQRLNKERKIIRVNQHIKSAVICEKLVEWFSQIFADQGADKRR